MAERFIICDDPEILSDSTTGAEYKLTMVKPPTKPKTRPADPDSLVEFLVNKLNTHSYAYSAY